MRKTWPFVVFILFLGGMMDDPVVNYMNMTKNFEGWRDTPYLDTVGKRTVGYGFNIADPEIAKHVPTSVAMGMRPLSKDEAEPIFNTLFTNAMTQAIGWVGNDTWNKMTPNKKYVLTDMSYNMGPKLQGFNQMKKALIAGDYQGAAAEMKNSKWYGQVGNRSKKLIKLMQE